MSASQLHEEPAEHPIFGKAIHTYTRKQALEDGFQVDATETAKEAGIKYPLFLTRSVWEKYVTVPPGVSCQDERGRLWDIVWMLRCRMGRVDGAVLTFQLYVRNDNHHRPRLVTLVATVGAMDFDDPQPAITVQIPGED